MQEVFDKIKVKLEEQIEANMGWEDEDYFRGNTEGLEAAINIVDQVAKECMGKFIAFSAYKQVAWERDIAIDQLHELGYEFGQKIDAADDEIRKREKDELKFRIQYCLDELNYSINEQFFKKTLRMMLEYLEGEQHESKSI